MPSPVGHALGGIAAGILIAGLPQQGGAVDRRAASRRAAVFAAIGVAPDLDLLVGLHSGPTHGLGVALAAGLAAAALKKWDRPPSGKWDRPPSGKGDRPTSEKGDRPPSGKGDRPTSGGRWVWAAAVAAAYASHTLLDWLGTDGRAPIGIMALWPFTREYYESPLHVFMGVSRRYWLPDFWRHNVVAVLREVAILAPLALLAATLRRGGRSR